MGFKFRLYQLPHNTQCIFYKHYSNEYATKYIHNFLLLHANENGSQYITYIESSDGMTSIELFGKLLQITYSQHASTISESLITHSHSHQQTFTHTLRVL